MKVFVPEKVNREGTEDELFAWELMGPGGTAPPLEPEEDPEPPVPPQLHTHYTPNDITIDGKTYQWRDFPASVCPCLYPANENQNDYPVETYGRYGYIHNNIGNSNRGGYEFMIPFWYHPDMPDEMLYLQFHLCAAISQFIYSPTLGTQPTSYDSVNNVVTTAPQINPRPGGGFGGDARFGVYNTDVQKGSTTIVETPGNLWYTFNGMKLNGLIPVKINRPSPDVAGMHTVSVKPYTGKTTSIFAAFAGWWPTDVTFKERNGSQWSFDNCFRLAESAINNNWKLTLIGTDYNPIGLNEQSEDKDNMHAYVQTNNTPIMQPFTMPPIMNTYYWPCMICLMGAGWAQFVNDTNLTPTFPPAGFSGRADNQNLKWQRSAMYPTSDTIGWYCNVTSGSGMIFSAITYLCDKDVNTGDRDLKGYGNNQGGWPTTRWQQGIASFSPTEFTGSLVEISRWNDTTKKWERPAP